MSKIQKDNEPTNKRRKLDEIPIHSMIDHTVLKQTTSKADIQKLCEEANRFQFHSICIPQTFIEVAKQYLGENSTVNIATVIGFPFGYNSINGKIAEIKDAIALRVHEIDIVANICAIKDHDYDYLRNEIQSIMNVVNELNPNLVVKVIIESGILTDEEIIECCNIYSENKIHYLKTSTGFAEKGASPRAVALFRKHLSPHVKIKASGGIRTLQDAQQMVSAGADRLGCSSSVAIVTELDLHQDSKNENTDNTHPGLGY